MHGGPFRTTQADGWTAVSLPYQGGKLAMLALLPPGAGACPTVSAGAMKALSGGLAAPVGGKRLIALPRVSLSSKLKMNGLLGTLGMGHAFGPGADFAGLSPQACCIGLVEHAATLQVGEKGTVASAATAVGMSPTAAEAPPQVLFDRPYLLLVTDTRTGEPLFLARVADPATS
jgi:serpin B